MTISTDSSKSVPLLYLVIQQKSFNSRNNLRSA